MMYPGRRHVLVSASALVATAVWAGASSVAAETSPSTKATLFLRSTDLDEHSLVVQLRRASGAHPWREQVVQVSTYAGFSAARALLDRAAGHALIALLDDLDEMAVDRLLTQRGARDRTRRRVDRGALLLTARI